MFKIFYLTPATSIRICDLFIGLETFMGYDCDVTWAENKDRGIEIGEFQTTGGFQTAYFVFQSHFGLDEHRSLAQ